MRVILGITTYTVQEVADMLGLSSMTIYTYIRDGRLPARKIAGAYHITEDNLKEYIKGTRYTDATAGKNPAQPDQ